MDVTRRIEAVEKGTDAKPIDEKLVDGYVGWKRIADAPGIGSNSAESMLARVDNPALDAFLTDKTTWGKDADQPVDRTKIPTWRIDVKYRKEDEQYNALKNPNPAFQARLRDAFMATHEAYRKDMRRKEAYGLTNSLTGEKFPTTQVENYVDYNELTIKGKRQERFLVQNSDFANAMHRIKGIDLPDPAKVPAVQYDDIYDQHKDTFDKLEGLGNNTSRFYIEDVKQRELTRKGMLFDTNGKYTEFGLADMRRDAYGKFVPENHVESYVGYYTIIVEGKPKNLKATTGTDLWYEDDWYMIDHPEFYKEVYLDVLKNERKDYRKVPTREVFAKYLIYLQQPFDRAKDDYRRQNPDLDDWGVIALNWTKIKAEKQPGRPLTPAEKLREEYYARQKEVETRLAAIGKGSKELAPVRRE